MMVLELMTRKHHEQSGVSLRSYWKENGAYFELITLKMTPSFLICHICLPFSWPQLSHINDAESYVNTFFFLKETEQKAFY